LESPLLSNLEAPTLAEDSINVSEFLYLIMCSLTMVYLVSANRDWIQIHHCFCPVHSGHCYSFYWMKAYHQKDFTYHFPLYYDYNALHSKLSAFEASAASFPCTAKAAKKFLCSLSFARSPKHHPSPHPRRCSNSFLNYILLHH
jgi:hypothetical protein